MKLKFNKILLIIAILISSMFLIENKIYATSIVSVSSENVNLNSDFYLIINLSNISYKKFKVEITNTSSLTPKNVTENVSELSNNNNLTSFVIDKSSISLDKIGIVYNSGKDMSTINFEVKIISLDDNTSDIENQIKTISQEITSLNSEIENLKKSLEETDENSDEYTKINDEILEIQNEILIKNESLKKLQDQVSGIKEDKVTEKISVNVKENNISQNDNDKSAWGDMDQIMKDKKDMPDMDDEKMSNSMKEMMLKMSDLESDLKNANNTISSLTNTNVYQGSQNNYLKSLSLTGIEFKNEFSKTTLDYFANIDKNISNVSVNAVAEDSSAIVTIYGNTNLQEGRNKIIISVTSEDGSVRNYKIYVTK